MHMYLLSIVTLKKYTNSKSNAYLALYLHPPAKILCFQASWCFIWLSICLLEISGDRTNAWLGMSSIPQALRHHDGQIARTVYFGIFFRKEEDAKVVTRVLQNKGLCASTAHDLMSNLLALTPRLTQPRVLFTCLRKFPLKQNVGKLPPDRMIFFFLSCQTPRLTSHPRSPSDSHCLKNWY